MVDPAGVAVKKELCEVERKFPRLCDEDSLDIFGPEGFSASSGSVVPGGGGSDCGVGVVHVVKEAIKNFGGTAQYLQHYLCSEDLSGTCDNQ